MIIEKKGGVVCLPCCWGRTGQKTEMLFLKKLQIEKVLQFFKGLREIIVGQICKKEVLLTLEAA